MKTPLFFIVLMLLCVPTFGQDSPEILIGKVWVISFENVYVKFENTEGIQVGDTLYFSHDNKLTPALIVNSLSSISCVGTAITKNEFTLSAQVEAKKKVAKSSIEDIVLETRIAISPNDQAMQAASVKQAPLITTKQRFDGRLSVSSYTHASNTSITSERLRYNLSINANNIGTSNLSAASYISFSHLMSFPAKSTDWTTLNNALKIYSLAVKYDISNTSSLSFGRRIYNHMSNIGAVDGFQFEKIGKKITYGALIGSRPDYFDYSFNPKLLQFGAFVSHELQNNNGRMQTSLAVFNQMNDFKTDRRFVYFQHTNSLVKNIDLFSSVEVDLYGFVNNRLASIFDLTSAYISIRYKPYSNLSTSLSYDARKNIYYYETFPKNRIDSTIDKETRQGLKFRFMHRPFKYFIWGGSAGYNLFTINTTESMNANSYLSYTQLPFNTYGTFTFTALKTSRIDKMLVYGVSLNRDFLLGKVNAQIEYRHGKIKYSTLYNQLQTPTPIQQNIAQMSVFWRIARKTTLSANFEGTFEITGTNKTNYGSLYLNISQRF